MAKTCLKFYNVLTRGKEDFKPLQEKQVGLYACGPTVYNFTHIGNLRTYIFEDILRRTLEYGGYKVKHVMNITDVEDKIIRDSQKTNKTIYEFTKPYEKAFFKDLKKLNILKAKECPAATKHIPEMIELISKLLEKGIAYESNGSVYFDIAMFENYGALSGFDPKELKAGARVDADDYNKENARDFVLWKAFKPGEPFWSAPFGKGRPGWHIECSAMSMKYLGETFDIHAGAVDLIFPHHENEIAQSEAATGKPFANYFLEGEHLLVDGQKMAKSLENFYTLRDIEKRNFSPLAFRYLVLTAHYRSKLNFTWNSLEAAQNSLDNISEFWYNACDQMLSNGKRINTPDKLKKYKKEFKKAVFDDLNTPGALVVLWQLREDYYKNPESFDAKNMVNLLKKINKVLGLGFKKHKKPLPEILELVDKRNLLREEKKWDEADEIRKEIEKLGWEVKDTAEGTRLTEK